MIIYVCFYLLLKWSMGEFFNMLFDKWRDIFCIEIFFLAVYKVWFKSNFYLLYFFCDMDLCIYVELFCLGLII